MSADPRAALAALVAALERHLELASSRRDPDDPAVVAAADAVAEAFDDYDEALFEATDVATPLAVYGDGDDDEDPVDGPGEDVGDVYAGLDDEDVDYDEDDEDDDGDDDDEDDDDGDDDERG